MTDTSLILQEIKLLRVAMEEIRDAIPKRAKPQRRANPTIEQVKAYAEERGRSDMAQRFFDFYTEGRDKNTRWTNVAGKPIVNWKATFVQWEARNKIDNTEAYTRKQL